MANKNVGEALQKLQGYERRDWQNLQDREKGIQSDLTNEEYLLQSVIDIYQRSTQRITDHANRNLQDSASTYLDERQKRLDNIYCIMDDHRALEAAKELKQNNTSMA